MTNESNATPHQAAEPAPSEQQAAFAKAQRWLESRDWKLDGQYFVKVGHCETMGVDAVALIVGAVLDHVAASPAPRAVAEPGEHLAITLDMLDYLSGYPDFTAPEGELIATAIADAIAGKWPKMLIDLGYLAMGVRPPLSAAPAPTPSEDARMLDWLESDACTHVFKIGNRWYTRDGYQQPHKRATSLREAIRASMSADGAVGEGNRG